MPSSMSRKAARAERFTGLPFVADSSQRIVDGVRYDIIRIPAANCAGRKAVAGPPAPRRRNATSGSLAGSCDCDTGCGRSAIHFNTSGKLCHACRDGLHLPR